MLSPSLFGARRLVVIASAQDVKAAMIESVTDLMRAPAEDVCLVLLHPGGAKGKALLAAARNVKALEISCAR